MQNNNLIIHIDMDAFFASIEQRDNPAFKSKPVIVGADPKGGTGRGVVATCSYEARRFGIHSAMPISIAYKKCPHGIYVRPRMKQYEQVSEQIHSILYDFTPDIEMIGIDEAFLDITRSYHLFGSPHDVCLRIKERIKAETGLTASIGLAPIKMAAKIASDLKKPDGLVIVEPDKLREFLWPLDISRIWGLGKKTQEVFRKHGINRIGELARMDLKKVIDLFGKNGAHFWQLAHGIDERTVEPDNDARSISNEITFDVDTKDSQIIESSLMRLCEKVSDRLRNEGLQCRTITLKIRTEGFKTYTRSITISAPANYVDILSQEIKRLYHNFEYKNRKIRLVGVKASQLTLPVSDDLFQDAIDEKKEKIHIVIDSIKDKFGSSAIKRGRSVIKKTD